MDESTCSSPMSAPAYPGPGQSIAAELIDPQTRHRIISQAAYFRAERRGFEPGHEVEDWCAAEAEVDGALRLGMMT